MFVCIIYFIRSILFYVFDVNKHKWRVCRDGDLLLA